MSSISRVAPAPRQQRSLYLLLAIVAFIAAVWFWLYFAVPKQQTLDQHVRSIASQLRCPVCQGESVADAPPLIAQQMRAYIRQEIQAGASDQQIIQYLSSRYGSNIVWVPQWQGFTLLAWIVPMLLLLAGLIFLTLVVRDWQNSALLARGQPVSNIRTADATALVEGSFLSDEDAELERYRVQLEQEIAAADPLFRRTKMEAD
ncbi:cytochrome c-type biogenesis protein [Dictyobacter arantiisoli]|uniref:Cytochrome c-type biogenesis protein n=1 Tax=Dictyobacter arantiisoli TaxID=2014874 RepID=A0A5A5T9Z5_9CHLR|nr:cytochrome c-type biogenesis protein [Dictyobacter arantiisoli]GCF08321.1 hypothetical protein KDI_18850 [Dictyobacter arantiisoli]